MLRPVQPIGENGTATLRGSIGFTPDQNAQESVETADTGMMAIMRRYRVR
jgi:hypothetical protein